MCRENNSFIDTKGYAKRLPRSSSKQIDCKRIKKPTMPETS